MNNFIKRTLTGALFVLALVGCMVYSEYTFALLFSLITGLGVWEFCGLVNQRDNVAVNRPICTLGGVYLFLAFFTHTAFAELNTAFGSGAVFIPYLIILIYLFVRELYMRHEDPIHTWAYSMLSQIYVALPFALLNLLAFFNVNDTHIVYSWGVPLALFIFLWCSDTGAYLSGVMFGKHKLFPRISPKKSWEGSIGGCLLTLLVAYLIAPWIGLQPLACMGLGVVVVVFGTWGDLVESLLKRKLGIKDSGNILPGHGGILDRFDSALMAILAAIVYFYTLMLF
ncbi:MAG: phosphatidate cytidylyltransferase [Bacteroidaceae bacterium]|nr:phosphatidate cytidylyltransferase [Bacteroidaceae bacterium]